MFLRGSGLLAVVVALLSSTLLTSCGGKDTHAKIMADTHAVMKNIAEALESVEDEKTAATSTTTLNTLAWKLEQIAERNDAIGAPDQVTLTALRKKYRTSGTELKTRLTLALEKIATHADDPDSPLPGALARISDAVEKMR